MVSYSVRNDINYINLNPKNQQIAIKDILLIPLNIQFLALFSFVIWMHSKRNFKCMYFN